MTHILHIITTINRGGAENHLFDLARAQHRQGCSVSVAYLKGDGYWANAMRAEGIETTALGLRRYGDLAPVWRLRTLIRTAKPDFIHAHMPPAELYTRVALVKFDWVPDLIISKHNDEPFFNGFGQNLLARWVVRRASRVIAISNAVHNYTHSQLGVPESRLRTVHYGIDPEPFNKSKIDSRARIRDEWGITKDTLVIGTVARMVPQKALHILLEAYALYLQSTQEISRLVFVGRGPLEQKLKLRAYELGIQNNIIWAGFREDISSTMAAFDVFSLTSSYEGFGLVLLEAMAASLPIVASNVSAIPEIVDNEKTGILCAPSNPQEFADAFRRLEDNALRLSFGSGGHKKSLNNFTISQMANKTKSIYEECLFETVKSK